MQKAAVLAGISRQASCDVHVHLGKAVCLQASLKNLEVIGASLQLGTQLMHKIGHVIFVDLLPQGLPVDCMVHFNTHDGPDPVEGQHKVALTKGA